MNTSTLTRIVPDADLDTAVDGAALGDDILLSAAGAEKTKKVKGGSRSSFQSHTARAWTRGGNVD